jgi:Ca2+-transporting ATPase
LWVNFLVTVPVALALGFDEPAPNLMEHKPRPLKQPILSRSQWVRVVFIGLVTALVTVFLESVYEAEGVAIAATMGFIAFSLLSIVVGLTARSETASAFNRDIFHNRNQLMLYGLALLFTFLPTELAFLQRILGTTSLNGDQWLICIGFAIALLLVDEVIKFFMRRSQSKSQPEAMPAAAA